MIPKITKRKFDAQRNNLHEIIFEADTPAGKNFDIVLLIAILASVFVVMLESIGGFQVQYGKLLYYIEWFFTILFTVEYLLRLYCVYRPLKYATSFFGIVDLLAILPTFVGIILTGAQSLVVIRALRLIRVFRIFKLGHFLRAGKIIVEALKASRARITVFLIFILLMVTIIGSAMYLIEGGQAESGFTSIPKSIYWTIVTLTTVGYGDITPTTVLGQFLSALVMILGYAVIAVPTGIVSAEFIRSPSQKVNSQACKYCSKEGHDNDATYCKYCGELIN